MTQYLIRRLVLAVIVVWVVLSFVFLALLPRDGTDCPHKGWPENPNGCDGKVGRKPGTDV